MFNKVFKDQSENENAANIQLFLDIYDDIGWIILIIKITWIVVFMKN